MTSSSTDLLYLLTIFAVEPATETRGLHGSLGRVALDGEVDWHVEVVQVRREPGRYSSGAALAVVYRRIEARDHPNVVEEEDVRQSFELLNRLIAAKEWRTGRALSLRRIYAANYNGEGCGLGGSVYSNMIWGAGSGSLGADEIDPAALEQNPELGHSIRFYVRGLAAAEEQFLPDSLMNYVRSLECLVGSAKHREKLEAECRRLGVDTDDVLALLNKTRNRYSIAHALDIVRGRIRKLKEFPSPEMERDARALARQTIEAYVRNLEPVNHEVELAKGIRYSGLPPVSTNLPLPLEFLLGHRGPWDQAAPGMARDWEELAVVARLMDISPDQLRRLVGRHRVHGYKDGGRWQVSSVSAELYQAFRAESGMSHKSGRLTRITNAARDFGFEAEEIRDLIRGRKLPGRLQSRRLPILRDMVDENAMRFLRWRRNRDIVVKKLYKRRL